MRVGNISDVAQISVPVTCLSHEYQLIQVRQMSQTKWFILYSWEMQNKLCILHLFLPSLMLNFINFRFSLYKAVSTYFSSVFFSQCVSSTSFYLSRTLYGMGSEKMFFFWEITKILLFSNHFCNPSLFQCDTRYTCNHF